MRYVYDLTVPANTLESAPEELEVSLVTGTIKGIEISFRPGPAWMTYVSIHHGLLQISPANPNGYHNCDDYTERFSMNYPLAEPDPLILLRGWSPGTIYQHIITFRFDIIPKGGDDREVLLKLLGGGFKPYE